MQFYQLDTKLFGGEIKISEMKEVRVIPGNDQDFDVITNSTTYHFRARSGKKERAEWVDYIRLLKTQLDEAKKVLFRLWFRASARDAVVH